MVEVLLHSSVESSDCHVNGELCKYEWLWIVEERWLWVTWGDPDINMQICIPLQFSLVSGSPLWHGNSCMRRMGHLISFSHHFMLHLSHIFSA